ncbi:hypothetical protein FJTKL_07611 [Diaporthe vaccinii]|uniref:SnoaL-like domain-containing protein n=1 Tax=Diaporthe vaccinii TaxID=105482 RepID=A0ABR4ETE8_9PEZI
MPDLHSLPDGWLPGKEILRNNGPDNLVIERLKLRELAKGWPCYRDACEWENFASIFHEDAYVYTTWSGRVKHTDFIEGSKADGCEVHAEADCRFIFFFEKKEGRWGARFVRHWYEKDKLIPVNPAKVPVLDEEKLNSYPDGYKVLAYGQEATMGVSVLKDMPGHRRHAGTPSGDKHDLLHSQARAWLKGGEIEI